MQCDKCQEAIEAGEEREFRGQTLCEDCYMDAISPARSCDPWAVHSAKSFIEGSGAQPEISETQAKILRILEETGGAEFSVLLQRLRMKTADLEREIAALRHMERVRGQLKDGRKILRLW